MKKKLAIFSIIFIFALAKESIAKPQPLVGRSNADSAVQKALLSLMESDPCYGIKKGECLRERIPLGSASPESWSAGRRVLILDTKSSPLSGFHKYRHQLIQSLEFDSSETEFRALSHFAMVTPASLRASENLRFSMPGLTKTLGSIGNKIGKGAVLREKPWGGLAHGDWVFNLLAERNPWSQFVIAEFPEPNSTQVCELIRDRGILTIEKMYREAASQILTTIKDNQIDFVNVSYASTLDSLSTHFENYCKRSATPYRANLTRWLLAKTRFLETIADLSGVLIVQSVGNSLDHSASWAEDEDSFVCRPNEKILRVGYISKMGLQIPLEGASLDDARIHRLIPRNLLNLSPCLETAINSQFDEDPLQIETFAEPLRSDSMSLVANLNGFATSPLAVMSTSFATPLALSLILFLKGQGVSHPENSLRGKVLDPEVYKSYEIYELKPNNKDSHSLVR